MHKTSRFSLLLLAAVLPTLVHAAKWVAISNKDQMRIEVDTSSIHSTSDGKLRIWHREIHAQPKIPDSGAFSFTRKTTLTDFQCTKRLATPIQRSYTATDGTELKTENFDNLEPKPIAPDSSLEVVFNYACKHRAKPVAVKDVAPPPAAAPPATEVLTTGNIARGRKKAKDESPAETPQWSYTGNTGADKWGSLDKEFVTCSAGQRQSPIDIRKTIRADLPPIKFAYKQVPLSIVDNGHSIKVDTPDAGGITVDGESYDLLQFHFHKPSEEKFNGKVYAMVAHLVHQSKAGKLAVVAVMMETGKEQGLIRTLWTNLPLEKGKPLTHADIKIDPNLLIPAKRNYFTFLGSLTTPPCTEGVLWLVLKTPMQVSREQLAGFGTIYKNNVRPIQAVNSRVIKESR